MARAGLILLTVLVAFLAIWSLQEKLMATGAEDLVRPEFQVQKSMNGQGNLHSSQCPNACTTRCSKTQYRKPCMFYCQKCCKKCLCVPPGYYGNKQVCPCYNNWKTKRGGPKCP
uniref:Uncharacterized protein n=1 Tax=Picea sitchensis TaxID=3332 RepID=D5A9M7_PICSI|nr:unknown [Picea sitchensis]